MNMIELARLRHRHSHRCSSWDTTGCNTDRWTLKPGETRVLADIEGPAVITHIWITGLHLRECLLRITWDQAPAPSILTPLGDFFGLGHGLMNSYQSLMFSASANANNQWPKPGSRSEGCALNSYVAMPFRTHARIELVNESEEDHLAWFYIDYETVGRDELAGLGYFHAEFRRANPVGGWAPQLRVNSPESDVPNLGRAPWDNNHVIVDTQGRGNYVGCNLSVANFKGQWWGEGDDMIWVDGYKWPPDLHGTGSEDYFCHAWGMQRNAFLRNGSSLHEQDTHGYATAYVQHIENPIRFERELKVTIEAGHANHLANDVSSVGYWYAEIPTPVLAPPPVAQRKPVLRDNAGHWLYDPTSLCPGKPVPRPDGAVTKEIA
jgi:hypothetical protein